MGLQAVDGASRAFLVAINAGGHFRSGADGKVPAVRDLKRADALLYRQLTAIRRQLMVAPFEAWEAAATYEPDSLSRAPAWRDL